MGEDDQIQTFQGTLVYLKQVLKKFLEQFQKYKGGGGQGNLNFSKKKQIFLRDGSPKFCCHSNKLTSNRQAAV